MSNNVEYIFLNGNRKQATDVVDSLLSSALFYGTGCFETMRYEKKQILRFDNHINRLLQGLSYLGLSKNLFPKKEELHKAIIELIQENGIHNRSVRVRLQCSLLEHNGYQFDPESELLTHISATPIKAVEHPAKLMTAKTRVIPSRCRPPGLKLSNMLHYRAAYREAAGHGFDDALLLTVDNAVAETSVANIFWLSGNTVYTPSTDCDILPGIMRESMIRVIKKMGGYNLIEGVFNRDSVMNSDVVWITNSVLEFRPVHSLDDVVFRLNEPFFEEVRSTFNEIK